ncbi:MAG: OmpA family protein [Sandaracinus sp.]
MQLRSPSRLAVLALVLAAAWAVGVSPGHAQAAPSATIAAGESEHVLSLSLRGGAMVTDDQRQILRFDQEGGGFELSGGLRPLPWLSGELGIGGLAVGGRNGVGGLLDLSLGLRAMPRLDRVTPMVRLAVGVGATGTLLVPVLLGSAGLWIDIVDEWSIGPELSIVHVVWTDGPTQTGDAVFVSLGLSVAFRPRPSAPPEPPREIVLTRVTSHTRVVERRVPSDPVVVPPPAPTDPEALLRLVDRAVPATVTRTVQTMVPPLLFEHDRTDLSSCGEASLYDLLRSVDEAPRDALVVIEGHADGTGEEAYNDALSRRRAEAVRAFLVAHGIEDRRIEIRAHGEGAPLVREDDARALELNRRVVVHLERTVSVDPSEATP